VSSRLSNGSSAERPGIPDAALSLADRVNYLFSTRLSPRGHPYTLKEVHKGTGGELSLAWLSGLRNGRFDAPSGDKLQALAEFFGVAIGYFFGGPSVLSSSEPSSTATLDEALRHALSKPGLRDLTVRLSHLTPGELSSLVLMEAHIYDTQGRAQLALAAAVEAERLSAVAGLEHSAAKALRIQARAHGLLAQFEKAIALAQASATLFEGLGVPREALHSRRIVALNLWRMGRFSESIALHRRNLQETRRLRWTDQQAWTLLGLGGNLHFQGDLNAAERSFLETLTLAHQLKDYDLIVAAEYHLANVWVERAWLVAEQGDPGDIEGARAEALERFERTLSLAQQQGQDQMILFTAVDLAVALAHWGDVERAHTLIALAQQTLVRIEDHVAARGWTLLSTAEVDLAAGEIMSAIQHSAEALPLLEEGAPAALAQAHRVAALAHTAQGALALAAPHWDASLTAARSQGQVLEEKRTLRSREGS